ncbi:MAG: hypothetical protein ACXWLH_06455 [Candidatus Saccharimonadales bacterium]
MPDKRTQGPPDIQKLEDAIAAQSTLIRSDLDKSIEAAAIGGYGSVCFTYSEPLMTVCEQLDVVLFVETFVGEVAQRLVDTLSTEGYTAMGRQSRVEDPNSHADYFQVQLFVNW